MGKPIPIFPAFQRAVVEELRSLMPFDPTGLDEMHLDGASFMLAFIRQYKAMGEPVKARKEYLESRRIFRRYASNLLGLTDSDIRRLLR